jgi:Mg/Co/Ni transporter MgtE
MEGKKILNIISLLEVEGALKMPVSELETFDNAGSIKFIKRQKLQQKALLNKEKYAILFNSLSAAAKEKKEALKNLSTEAVLTLIKQRDVNFQFRNLEKLDKNQLREILEDLYVLDELNEEE